MSERRIVIGKIGAPYGVKGWVKVFSFTEPKDNLFSYKPWLVKLNGEWQEVNPEEGRPHGKTLVARLSNCDDRNQAERLKGCSIAVRESQLPSLAEDEFYWKDLEQLEVINVDGERLGKVSHLMETGSNDVLVVIDAQVGQKPIERLIPYLPDQVVKRVDLKAGVIEVDWDADF